MAISTRNEALDGLVALGATVKNLSNVALGSQSYRYKAYFDALALGTVTYPCTLAVMELEKQIGFMTLTQNGTTPVTKFNLIHYLLHYKVAGTADFTAKEPDVVTMLDHYDQALAAFAANGGWSVVNHGKVDMRDPLPATKFTMEGVTYHASIYTYAIQLFL